MSQLQPARPAQLDGGSVAVTARREPAPRAGEAVLPTGEPRRLRADVLKEQQPTPGAQHPADLPQHQIGRVQPRAIPTSLTTLPENGED